MICRLGHFTSRILFLSLVGGTLLIGAMTTLAVPVAVPPYKLTAFKGIPPAGATQPDDLAVSADGREL